jgi:hypothetical protein
MLHRVLAFPRNRAKSLIHIRAAPLLKKSATKGGTRRIKGLEPAEGASPQSYPQKQWIAVAGFTNQELKHHA